MIAGFDTLNHRQRALLERAARHPLESYTIEGHATSHRVHYHTARADLKALVEQGFLERKRAGKSHRYHPGERLKPAIEGRARAPRTAKGRSARGRKAKAKNRPRE